MSFISLLCYAFDGTMRSTESIMSNHSSTEKIMSGFFFLMQGGTTSPRVHFPNIDTSVFSDIYVYISKAMVKLNKEQLFNGLSQRRTVLGHKMTKLWNKISKVFQSCRLFMRCNSKSIYG